ncbi:hypothetical protein BV20DRAFT_975867 [Pilatotrama ljubarskyi]|nr:hypothetical protein BV20DRAFT_975867 [Pilatotrama ljubarskyi]
MSAIDKYKIPRAQVNVEALAQQMFLYLRVHAEDTQFLSHDPTRREQIIAEMYAHTDRKPFCWPPALVAADLAEQYDGYLAQADDAIARLTPPKSLEDRVLRAHVALAATMVFRQYKIAYALQDHQDLAEQVAKRWCDLMGDWMATEFPRLFPDFAAKPSQSRQTSAAPTHPNPLSRLSTPHPSEAETLAADEIAGYLQYPGTIVGKRFLCTPPPGEEEEYVQGTWEVQSYRTRVVDGEVDQEFWVVAEAFDNASVPMGHDEIESLLKHSTRVG